MKSCRNYHCENKGKQLKPEMFPKNNGHVDVRGNTCKSCIRKTYVRKKVKKGTLRARMEADGRKLSGVGL